jgi:two-component system, OmpR family, sensor kinase
LPARIAVRRAGAYEKDVPKVDLPGYADLLSLVAHDLRNPLAALVANLGYLRSAIPKPAPEVAGAISDAELACARLEKMTRNLAVIARASSPGRTEHHPTSLRDVARSAVNRARPAAERSRVGIDLVDGDVPHVLADSDLLGVALDNLLSNSIQYSPVGHRVSVELSAAAGHATVTVVDDGPIVPDALRGVVVLADGQCKSKGRAEMRYGSGLGLYSASTAAALAGAALAIGEKGGLSAFAISADVAHC